MADRSYTQKFADAVCVQGLYLRDFYIEPTLGAVGLTTKRSAGEQFVDAARLSSLHIRQFYLEPALRRAKDAIAPLTRDL